MQYFHFLVWQTVTTGYLFQVRDWTAKVLSETRKNIEVVYDKLNSDKERGRLPPDIDIELTVLGDHSNIN